MPESEEGYIHRVGRTARWDKEGRAFFITGPDEHIPSYVEGEVELFLPSPVSTHPSSPKNTTLYIGKGKKDKVSKGDIVGFLCKIGGLKADEIGRIDIHDRYAYVAVKREKAQQVIRQTQGEKIKGIKTIVEPVR
jgi:superfamily II DNA/RNA helicase